VSAPLPRPEDRLEQSRGKLLVALRSVSPSSRNASPGSQDKSGLDPQLEALLDALKTSVLLATHPLKLALTNLAERRPLTLALGALLIGAFTIWSKPWRWIPVTALMAGLLPHLVNKIATAQLLPSKWTELIRAMLQGLPPGK